MAERLLILGAGPFQLPAIHKAQEMGFQVIATDANPLAVGLQKPTTPIPLTSLIPRGVWRWRENTEYQGFSQPHLSQPSRL